MQAVHSQAGYIIIAIFFDFASGIFIALPLVCYIMLTKDKSRLGTRIGLGFTLLGLGTLVGGPGDGGVLGSDLDRNVAFAILRIWKFGAKLKIKA